jgi:hypothetical protein
LAEAADAGLHELALVAVEGPAWLLPDLDRRLADNHELLLRTIRRVEWLADRMKSPAQLVALDAA